MEMDLYQTLKEQKRKDAEYMTSLFGDYRCMDNAWNDAYEILNDEKEEESRGEDRSSSLPESVTFLRILGDFIAGESGPSRGDDD